MEDTVAKNETIVERYLRIAFSDLKKQLGDRSKLKVDCFPSQSMLLKASESAKKVDTVMITATEKISGLKIVFFTQAFENPSQVAFQVKHDSFNDNIWWVKNTSDGEHIKQLRKFCRMIHGLYKDRRPLTTNYPIVLAKKE